MYKQFYQVPNPDLWTGRIDSDSDTSTFRLHQVVRCIPLHELDDSEETVLLGFASDEGVRRNKGRAGAHKGPYTFRKVAGSLAWHGGDKKVVDAGTIQLFQNDLEIAQEQLGDAVHTLLKNGKKTFVIGGGHETAYGHYLGVGSFLKEAGRPVKLGILNIDAHFDLRPHNGVSHSGSPFLQAFEHASEHEIDLSYFVYGINKNNNTKSLFKKAEELNIRFCTNREIFNSENESLKKVQGFIDECTDIYLTVCLDVFDAAIAPGVSAPAWNGIQLGQALAVVGLAKNSGKLTTMDVCELNPVYDQNDKTAKAAGTLFSEFIES